MTSTRHLRGRLRRAWLLHPRWSLATRGAIAAALAWVVGNLAPAPWSDFPYYAPLGAVVATTSTLARSVRESLQTVGALLIGAVIAVVTDAVLAPDAVSVAVVVGLALLCGGWRVLGDRGSWVANSAIFVLVLGQGNSTEYIGAYVGLVFVGALIGIGVNSVLPPLPLTPSDAALDELRDALVGQLDDLADWLEHKGPLEPEEWERRRRALWPTVEAARRAVARTAEARRGNVRARRHGERVTMLTRRADVLVTSAQVVDELVRLWWAGSPRAARTPPWGRGCVRSSPRRSAPSPPRCAPPVTTTCRPPRTVPTRAPRSSSAPRWTTCATRSARRVPRRATTTSSPARSWWSCVAAPWCSCADACPGPPSAVPRSRLRGRPRSVASSWGGSVPRHQVLARSGRRSEMGIEDQAGRAQSAGEGAADKAKEELEGAAEKAKEGIGGLLDKAKEFLTDENVDGAAEKLKGLTPDSVDSFVDKAAEQAKRLNG